MTRWWAVPGKVLGIRGALGGSEWTGSGGGQEFTGSVALSPTQPVCHTPGGTTLGQWPDWL